MATALITISPLAIVTQYVGTPAMITVPTIGDVHNISIGWTSGNFQFVSITIADNPPDPFATISSTSLSLAGNVLTITRNYASGTPSSGQLKDYVTSKRVAKASSGTALGAAPIPTDVTTLVLLSMAFTKASNDSTFTMGWIGSTGPITLTATNILNAARQVGTFLGQCKNAEATAINSINAGTITTTAQIDALFNF